MTGSVEQPSDETLYIAIETFWADLLLDVTQVNLFYFSLLLALTKRNSTRDDMQGIFGLFIVLFWS